MLPAGNGFVIRSYFLGEPGSVLPVINRQPSCQTFWRGYLLIAQKVSGHH